MVPPWSAPSQYAATPVLAALSRDREHARAGRRRSAPPRCSTRSDRASVVRLARFLSRRSMAPSHCSTCCIRSGRCSQMFAGSRARVGRALARLLARRPAGDVRCACRSAATRRAHARSAPALSGPIRTRSPVASAARAACARVACNLLPPTRPFWIVAPPLLSLLLRRRVGEGERCCQGARKAARRGHRVVAALGCHRRRTQCRCVAGAAQERARSRAASGANRSKALDGSRCASASGPGAGALRRWARCAMPLARPVNDALRHCSSGLAPGPRRARRPARLRRRSARAGFVVAEARSAPRWSSAICRGSDEAEQALASPRIQTMSVQREEPSSKARRTACAGRSEEATADVPALGREPAARFLRHAEGWREAAARARGCRRGATPSARACATRSPRSSRLADAPARKASQRAATEQRAQAPCADWHRHRSLRSGRAGRRPLERAGAHRMPPPAHTPRRPLPPSPPPLAAGTVPHGRQLRRRHPRRRAPPRGGAAARCSAGLNACRPAAGGAGRGARPGQRASRHVWSAARVWLAYCGLVEPRRFVAGSGGAAERAPRILLAAACSLACGGGQRRVTRAPADDCSRVDV